MSNNPTNLEEKNGEKFLQSYLYTDHGDFFISTAYRRSSAALNPDGWYYETLAWLLNESKILGGIVLDNSGAISKSRAINQHMKTVEQLLNPLQS